MDTKTMIALGVLGLGLITVIGYLFNSKEKKKPILDPTKKLQLKLIEKQSLTHDVRKFRFALPNASDVVGLPVGKHIYISTMMNGKLVSRPYSPVSSNDDRGFVEFVIKVYPPNPPQFPDGGILSQYMDTLKLGDEMDFRGPIGKIEYKGRGVIEIGAGSAEKVTKKVKHIGMIAGGTGITPLLAVVREIMKDPGDTTKISLIFANKTEGDIFLREELEECAEKHPNFKLHYTLDSPPEQWKYSKGFITEQLIRDHMPVQFPTDSVICICGPPPMINFACKPNLAKCSYPEDNILMF